jgi:GT2 family glycosyltransferase
MSSNAAKQQSGFDPVLAVMNPRQIPECISAFERLSVRKVWLSNYTEWQLVDVLSDIVLDEAHEFTHLCLVADDCIVTQDALDAVLGLAEEHPVVTGYCRLDSTHPEVNITRRPLMGETPSVGAYDFYPYDDVAQWPDAVVPTGFVGFALTCMSREMWARFPFGCFGSGSRGYSSDFHLSRRLRDEGVPMVAAKAGYVTHVKERWNQLDRAESKRLMIGELPAEVRWSQ